ncbi:MAG: YfiM family protein [Gammaproteobacteria bacterium]|nr:YfiM family protein [Gammaproteobacteria bacterium]
MEFGDSFGGHGFSRQDFIMNTLGAITGYIFLTRPELAKRIDIRVEYIPGGQRDIFTDYKNMKFTVALKLDDVQSVRNRYLKYLDLQLGYYTRHYSAGSQENKERNIYIAVGINLSHILHNMSHKKTAKFFNYYQMPYTYY